MPAGSSSVPAAKPPQQWLRSTHDAGRMPIDCEAQRPKAMRSPESMTFEGSNRILRSSSPLLLRFIDQLRDAIEFVIAQIGRVRSDQSADDFLGRAAEERLDEMIQG